MSHSKAYSPNFPMSQGYAPPHENKEHHPTAPYLHDSHVTPPPYPPTHASPYPPAQTSPYPTAQTSPYPPPYPVTSGSPSQGLQLDPGFKPAYQVAYSSASGPGPGYPTQQSSSYSAPTFPVPSYSAGFPHPTPVMQQQPPLPPMPITQQPAPAPNGWMSIPQGASNCPRGLEYLTSIDTLIIKQQIELLEAVVGFETNNKYIIKNSAGQKVYNAVEDTHCCKRICCGELRPFNMMILDNFGTEVMHLYRPLRCDMCCFPCCLQTLEVSAPPGNVIGTIEQQWSIFRPQFVVKNAAGVETLRIQGPLCVCCPLRNANFEVITIDGERKIGKITKQWGGLLREAFTDADCFGITFPLDLDVNMKATMLGACMLIDSMYYENNNKRS